MLMRLTSQRFASCSSRVHSSQCRPVFRSTQTSQRTRKVACRALISDAEQEKLGELERRFKMADVDGNGYIDREELRNLLQSFDKGAEYMFQHWLPEEELDYVMERYDANKDGVISLNEFRQLAYDGLLLEGTLAQYEQAFKAVDSSGNGTIGATELAALFQSLGQPMSMEALVEVMQKYDKDESGQIEFSEFLLMFRDKALDLKAMSEWMTLGSSTDSAAASGAIVEPVGTNMTLLFSEAELDALVAQAQKEGRVLMIFAALTWCRPCKAMQRPVQKFAEHYKSGLLVAKLFGNANGRTKVLFKERFQIRSTPCFILIKDGEVVYTQTGANKEKLETGLRGVLPAATLPAETLYLATEAPVAAQ